jgi:hypothetical protein
MIDTALLPRIRKIVIWAAVCAAAFFGLVAVAALIFSSGAAQKPMTYGKVVPRIELKPGERKVFEFESFCLDNHRGSPRSADAYSLMDTPAVRLRPYLGEIFNEYLSHPSRWKQSDVQQAVWYTEGHKQWESLSADRRSLIQTATGTADPVAGHPVIFLSRMASVFGTVVKTNLLLAIFVLALVTFTLPAPSQFLERGISWMVSPRIARKVARGQPGEIMDKVAVSKELDSFRIQIDVLFSRLVFRLFSRRR